MDVITGVWNGHSTPTTYRGTQFRSRLESRWAAFMDERGISWMYEPQGYLVWPDVFYLPDFWLPGLEIWLEIKPTEPSPEEYGKMDGLVLTTKRLGFIGIGHPGGRIMGVHDGVALCQNFTFCPTSTGWNLQLDREGTER